MSFWTHWYQRFVLQIGPNAVRLSEERIIRFLFFLVSNQPVMWTEITKYSAKAVQILGNFLEFESLDFSSFAYHDTPECHGGHYAKNISTI